MVRSGNRLILLENGAGYFPALIEALNAARHEIHLESYIFANDVVATAVAEALMQAARRGVQTRLLLDGYGSRGLDPGHLKALLAAGVAVFLFRPERDFLPLRRRHLRRMHRKMAVIDAHIGFIGGINLIDDFNGRNLAAPRQDYAVQVTGPLVADMHAAARRLWQLMQWSHFGLRRSEEVWLKPTTDIVGTQRARFLTRNSLRHRRAIETAYLRAIQRSRREILIANAYFLPGLRFRHALIAAAQRGVKVRLVMQGRSDHLMYQMAARALYRHFLENGVEVYEYHSSEMHAKVAVIDGTWSTVGSSNIDPFSLLLSREANIVVHDRGFARQLQVSLESAMARGAHRIHRRAWSRVSWHARFASWVAYGFVRLLMGLGGYTRRYDDISQHKKT